MKALSLNELSLVSGGLAQAQENSTSYQVRSDAPPPCPVNYHDFKSLIVCPVEGGLFSTMGGFLVGLVRGRRSAAVVFTIGAAFSGVYAMTQVLERLAFEKVI